MISSLPTYADMLVTTFGEASPLGNFPKVIVPEFPSMDDMFIISNFNEYMEMDAPQWVKNSSVVLEPERPIEISGVKVSLGVDYDTLVMYLPGGRSVVLKKSPPPPVLTYRGFMTFQWKSTFLSTTRVYRAESLQPVSSVPQSAFSLVAKIDPAGTPGGISTFTDFRPVAFPNYAYSYYIVNRTGKSNIVTLTSDIGEIVTADMMGITSDSVFVRADAS